MPEQFDQSVVDTSLFEIGKHVGNLAKQYFGNFIEVSKTQTKSQMMVETAKLMRKGTNVIAEGAFSYKSNFCMVDLLRKNEEGYDLIEVKSSTGSATDTAKKVKEIYYDDIAFQTYVVTGNGFPIKNVLLMQLNKGYVRQGDLDIQDLFVLTDCTEQVNEMLPFVEARISYICALAEQQSEPDISIGSKCDSPYVCGFRKWCFRNLPQNNIFQIGWGMKGSLKDSAYSDGIITFQQVADSSVDLSEKQLRQISTTINKASVHIDKEAVSAFLDSVSYPLCFLDFETLQQPIPLWNNVSPYAQLPFQYSLHIRQSRDSSLIHKEYLAPAGHDPRRALAEQLCSDIPPNSCVLVFNMSFEKGQIRKLALLFPDLKDELDSIHDSIIDLASPFQSGAYYTPAMGGSYSIKSVLPALFPDDKELDYHSLNLVQNGNDAMKAYGSLPFKDSEEREAIQAALLAYCKLDTYAMVKILEKLYESVSS